MTNRTRRQVLARVGSITAGASLLSGCTTFEDSSAVQGGRRPVSVDDQGTLPPGDYLAYDFELEGSRTFLLTVTVDEGPPIDVLTMPRENFRAYQDHDPFEYVTELSLTRVLSDSVGTQLPEGEYTLVVDNTDVAPAKPSADGDGVASFHVELEERS